MNRPDAPSDAARPRRVGARRRGSIAVYAAVTAIVLVGVVGLAIDTAWTMTARAQLQSAADAAALAGAAKLAVPGPAGQALARQAALDVAAANRVVGCCPAGVRLDPNAANAPAGDVVLGRWIFDVATHTSFFDPLGTPADAVQVRARCAEDALNPPLQLFFGQIFGQSTSQGGRPAIARLSAPPDPLVLVLDPSRQGSLRMNGNVELNVDAGGIQVDSADACALSMSGAAASISAQRIRVVGSACTSGTLAGDLFQGVDSLPDPLASIPEPDPSALGLPTQPAITGEGTFDPGYYPGGIDLTGGTATLRPGVYVFGSHGPGRGIDLSGQCQLVGTNVTLFLQDGSSLRTAGGSGVVLTPPASGTYQGISVFQARSNAATATIDGSGTWDVGGTVYLSAGGLSMGGNVGREIGQVVANTLELSGNGAITFTGIGIRDVSHPRHVYLVR